MLLDLRKGKPYAIIAYYDDGDYNEDNLWITYVYSQEELDAWEQSASEQQPWTGVTWHVYK